MKGCETNENGVLNLFHRSPLFSYCGVGEKGEYFSKYKYYLCFKTTIRTHKSVLTNTVIISIYSCKYNKTILKFVTSNFKLWRK